MKNQLNALPAKLGSMQELSRSLPISWVASIAKYLVLAFASVIGGAATANAQFLPVYDNIPILIPLNVFSQNPSSYGNFTEFGDGFTLAVPHSTLGTVTVVMQAWTCQNGYWNDGPGPNACVTSAGATYAMPVTVNVYSVVTGTSFEGVAGSPAPGTLLATATQTFNMPYRPSSDFVHCPVAAGQSSGGYYQWYNPNTQTCQDGIDFPITFDLSRQKIALPSQVIVTFSFNTSTTGTHPYGTGNPCNSAVTGCFYDSLNMSGAANMAAYPGAVPGPIVGSVLNVSGVFARFPGSNTALCGVGTLPANTLALDASPGCYTGNHPMIAVTAEPKL
jgi:hypothetical protein